ncbi:MAG: prepilin-type N-terminal cleavage/methylation domain-containing protein [Phycisphaerales bacterium]
MMKQTRERRGFTLVELMVVILIVGILAAVAVPILRGRVEQAKWSEAAATAGAIRTAVRAAYAEDPTTVGAWNGQSVSGVSGTLGFQSGDLTGRYFTVANFTIDEVDGNGNADISVSATGTGLTGSGLLDDTGWNYDPDGGSSE